MIDSLPALISILGIIIDYFQAQKFHNETKINDALKTIQEAVTETSKYLERDDLKERQRTKEIELSGLWKAAAISMRGINPEFSTRLRMKSEYWDNSAQLSRREIYQGGIALRQIKKELDGLFSSQ